MNKGELLMLMGNVVTLLFVGAYGACAGSLINVLVYRLPRGLSVVTPPSRCPACSTRLAWRDNIPVFGWLLLRGRCRYCGARISPEYPIVETFVALLFAGLYAVWYLVPDNAVWLGVAWGHVKPEWALNGFARTWPEFVVLLTLVGCLIAMTLVDAKTYTIPLELAWIPAVLAAVVLPAHAAWSGPLRRVAEDAVWTIPTPGRAWLGASIGGVVGLGVGVALLRAGLIRQSFADYEEWEKKVLSERGIDPEAPDADDPGDNDPHLWIQYPHARREMFKELVFLAPCLALGVFGAAVARRVAPGAEVPLWLNVLGGVLMGYLVGGGVVWGVRIFGSLAFGKEAMGLGDVHLLAAVGACLGWIDPVLTFFASAFIAVGWSLIGAMSRGKLARALPFGPYLAAAAVLVLLCKPLLEVLLGRLFHTDGALDLP